MFHPHRKKSLDNAINLTIHSNAKIDVKTLKKDQEDEQSHRS